MKNLTLQQLRNCWTAYKALPLWFRILDIGTDIALFAACVAAITYAINS